MSYIELHLNKRFVTVNPFVHAHFFSNFAIEIHKLASFGRLTTEFEELQEFPW